MVKVFLPADLSFHFFNRACIIDQKKIEKAIRNVMVKTNSSATIKTISAILLETLLKLSFEVRSDKKAKRPHMINNMQATPVASSIKVTLLNFVIFNEVKTTRQKPSKFEDVLRMCGELLLAI